MTFDDLIEELRRRIAPPEPHLEPPDNVVHILPAQQDLVTGIAACLNDAHEGRLHSFVGVGLYGDEDDMAVLAFGSHTTEPYSHIGALTALAHRLSENALDSHESDNPKGA